MKRLLTSIIVLSVAVAPFAQSLKTTKNFNDMLGSKNSVSANVGSSKSTGAVTPLKTPNSPKDIGATNGNVPPVPEPASMIALGTGVAAMIGRRKRRAR